MRRPRGFWGLVAAVCILASAAAMPAPLRSGMNGEIERLGAEISQLIDGYRWRRAAWSVLVVSLDRGDTLFAVAPDSARAPASNMKLLTSAAALRVLGPDFRFRTYVLADGPVRDGVVDGNLVLYGTGDPGISDRFYRTKETVFEELADQLLAQGITTVAGDVVGDASFFTGPLRPEGWEPEDLNDHFAAGVSALSFNENVVSLRVEAAPRSGWPPTVHTIPEHAGLRLQNRAVTVEGRARLTIGRFDPRDPILVEGNIQRGGRDVWRQMTVSEPAAFAVSVFAATLEARGIRVLGEQRVVTRPASSAVGSAAFTAPARKERMRTRTLAVHVSPPLRDYLAVVNKKSNNLFTELVFRTLGRIREGADAPGAAARAVGVTLAELGVDTTGLHQEDGSGLSAGNRVRATTFVDLFSRMASTPLWAEFWATLPEAGNRRELGRMYRTAAAGNLRAKTGTIEGVSALAGVVQSQDGERLAFSIMVNGTPSTTRAKSVENDIGVRLASFTRGADVPPLSRVAVLPPPPMPVDSGGPGRHRVEPGESMDHIARRYGLTLEELLRANPAVEPRRMRAGSWVNIPSGSSGSGARQPQRQDAP